MNLEPVTVRKYYNRPGEMCGRKMNRQGKSEDTASMPSGVAIQACNAGHPPYIPGCDIFSAMEQPGARRSQSSRQSDNDYLRQLLDSVATGKDERAFTALYDATIHLLYGVALRITQQDDMAEDVINETYMQVWKQAGRYRPGQGSVKTWLVMICRSRAIDALRRFSKMAAMQEFREDHTESGAQPVPDLLASIEQKSRLHEALEQLDSNQRQLLALAFFRGYTHTEMAAFLGMPLGTVKTRIRRAILVLRKIMASQEQVQS